MVKNKEEKSERRSSVTGGGGDGNGNRPNSERADDRKSSTTDCTTSIAPPARNRQQQKQHQSSRQERHKWTPSQSPNVLRNRKTRRSSLSTMDILNGLMNDSAKFDLIVGAGESATNSHTDDTGSDRGGKGALGRHQVKHIYGNDVDSAQKEESVQHKTQRPNTRDGGRVRRTSSLTTLGELCRRSSLGHLDLFGNSMLLNDSFVFKLQGSETFLPAAGEENNDQASTERPTGAGASTSSTNKHSPSRRVSFEGGRGESLGGGGFL